MTEAEPFSLAQRASQIQQQWASEYVIKHRKSRVAAWAVAVPLSGYVALALFQYGELGGPMWNVVCAYSFAGTPLALLMLGAGLNAAGERSYKSQIFACAVLGLLALLSINLVHEHRYLQLVLYTLSLLGIAVVPSWAWHIPLSPSVNWLEVYLESCLLVQTARGGIKYEPRIHGYKDAQDMAAAWLRRFGYGDAVVTADGPDNGIDVMSSRAIAQVKNWQTKRVGIADVQRLAGSAEPGQACYFFAASGYTRAAGRWASHPDHRVILFELRSDGNIVAGNYLARKRLWLTPVHVPAHKRRALPPWFVLTILSSFGLVSVVTDVVAVYLLVNGSPFALASLLGFTAVGENLVFCSFARSSLKRLVVAVRQYREAGRMPPWNVIFTEAVNTTDAGLPPDDFVGYDPSLMLTLINILDSIGLRYRTFKRRGWAS